MGLFKPKTAFTWHSAEPSLCIRVCIATLMIIWQYEVKKHNYINVLKQSCFLSIISSPLRDAAQEGEQQPRRSPHEHWNLRKVPTIRLCLQSACDQLLTHHEICDLGATPPCGGVLGVTHLSNNII